MRVDFESLNKDMKQPLHEQLADLFRGAIRAGVYRSGERLEPQRTVMRHSQLSQPTVVRALRDLAAEGLIVRRVGAGTFVQNLDAVHSKGLRRIGVTYYDTRTPAFSRTYAGIQEAAGELGIKLVAVPSGPDHEAEGHVVPLLEREEIDAVIAIPFGTELMQRELMRLLDRGVGVVSIGVHMPLIPCDTVGTDYERVGRLAARHLADLGHRRLAVLTNDLRYPNISGLEMISGLRTVMNRYDAELPERRIVRARLNFDEVKDYALRDQLLDIFQRPDEPPPTALVCLNDGFARYAYRVLGDAGLRIPEDVSVVGGVDLPLGEQLIPPVTTVAWPLERLGRAAVRMLHQRHTYPQRQTIHRVVDPKLIIRRSTIPVQS